MKSKTSDLLITIGLIGLGISFPIIAFVELNPFYAFGLFFIWIGVVYLAIKEDNGER